MRVGIIGCGQLGRCLCSALSTTEFRPSVVVSRSEESARTASRLAGGARWSTRLESVLYAELILLTVPDRLIRSISSKLSSFPLEGKVVVHTSGAHSAEALSRARNAGASVASFHPIQTFPSTEQGVFRGITFTVDGDVRAVDACQKLSEALGAKVIEIPAEKRELYHTALSIASNFFQTLGWLSLELLQTAGIEKPANALTPLLRTTLENFAKVGFPQALTGPISRGDTETIRKHLCALSLNAPHLLPLYRELGLLTVELAKLKGTLSEQKKEQISDLLRRCGER